MAYGIAGGVADLLPGKLGIFAGPAIRGARDLQHKLTGSKYQKEGGGIAGAITGAAVGIASDVVSVGTAATIVIGGGVLSGVASELVDAKISKRHSTVADFVISGLIGGVGSLIGYGAGGGHEGLVAVKEGVKELVGSFKKTVFKKVARNFFNDKLEEIATGSVFGVIEMAFNEALHRRAKLFFPDLGE